MEVGENLREFLARIAVIAIDQDRHILRRGLQHVPEIGDGDVMRLLDMSLPVGLRIADIENEHIVAREKRMRFVDTNSVECFALCHDDYSSLWAGCRPG